MDGVETFTVRFQEYQEYSMDRDAQVVRLLATTGTGTWHAQVTLEGAAKLRERRQAFKDYVLGAMAAKLEPCEVTIG